MMSKKLHAFLLALLLLAPVLCGCGGGDNKTDDVPKQPDETMTAADAAETEPVIDASNILTRYEKVNLDGEEFVILTSNNLNSSISLQIAPDAEQNGDPINDSLYERDRILEEYYNAKITYDRRELDKELYPVFSSGTLAGDISFDIMLGSVINCAVNSFKNSTAMNLRDLPHIDLGNEWWAEFIMDNFNYNGNYYMLVGEFSPRNVFAGNVLIFNLKEYNNRGLPNLYEKVREGTWTFDSFAGLIKGTVQDLNGDGMIGNGDFFGLNCDTTTGCSFYFGAGNTFTAFNGDELVDVVMEEKAVNMTEKIYSMFYTDDVYADSWSISSQTPNDLFMEGKALFNCMVIVDLTVFRDSDTDYGIVPIPKYNEEQEKHISLANHNVVTSICLSKATASEKLDSLGRLIESMAALGHYKSIPEAYESTLLAKLTRDTDSVEMLSIVNESLTFDFGYVYNIGGIQSLYREMEAKEKPIVSEYEKIRPTIQNDIKKIIELFDK